MEKFRYAQFLVFYFGLTIISPIAVACVIVFILQLNWPFAGLAFILWILYYNLLLGKIYKACKYPSNCTKIENLFKEERKKDFMSIVTIGLYPTLVLHFMHKPWDKWFVFFTPVRTFPWINRNLCFELIEMYHVPEKILDKEKASAFYKKGRLTLYIFDYINDCGSFAKN